MYIAWLGYLFYIIFVIGVSYSSAKSSRLRSTLVHSILVNLDFEVETVPKNLIQFNDQNTNQKLIKKMKKYCGIQMMISKGYFEDAFILHDDSIDDFHIKDLLRFNKSKEGVEAISSCMDNEIVRQNDHRLDLYGKWAKFKNTFKFQPLNLIKDYFGERMELYFTWVGAFITTLWIPAIIGLFFFKAGLAFSYWNIFSFNFKD